MYQVGDLIAGYRVLEVLGHGGMGEVYKAAHPRLPRADAIKVLRSAHATDPVFRARFEREADLVAPLNHPNIVAVYDRGVYDGRLWIAMELVPGTDAGHLVDTLGPLDPRLAMAIVNGAAAGLDAAHRRGITHRDIKPANILVTPGEDAMVPDAVKLTDFGIAQALDEVTSLTGTGTTVGTMRYSSPEQIGGHRVDLRSDIYSLGATAYELLTGAPPFEAPSLHGLMSAHMFAEPPRATERNRTLPPGVDPVLQRSVAKNPDHRFQSARDFATALGDAFDTRKTLVGPTPTMPPPTPAPAPAQATPGAWPTAPQYPSSPTVQPVGVWNSGPVSPPSAPPRKPRRLALIGTAIVLAAALVGALVALLMPDAGRLETPGRPDAKVTTRAVELTWNSVGGASSYVVKQNDQEIYTGPGTSYAAPLPLPGKYTYTVAARSDSAPGSEFSLASDEVTVYMTWGELQWVADLYPDLIPVTPLSTNTFDEITCSGGGGSLAFPENTQKTIDCNKYEADDTTKIYQISIFAFDSPEATSTDVKIGTYRFSPQPFTTTQGNIGTLYVGADRFNGGSATLAFSSGPRARTYVQVFYPDGTPKQAADLMRKLPI